MLNQLWKYSEKDSLKIVAYFCCHIISLLGVLGQPYAFSKIFEVIQINNSEVLCNVLYWLCIYICLFFVFNIFHRIGRFIEQRVSFRARQNFINKTYNKILHLPISWHSDNHSGNTINGVKIASDALFDFGEKQFQYIEYFMMFWGPLTALLLISYKISVLAMCIAFLIIFVITKFDRILVPLFQQETETQHNFLAVLFDYISNVKTIITLRLFNTSKKCLDKKIEVAYPILIKSITNNQYKWAVVSLLILFLEVSVIFYYVFLTKDSSPSVVIAPIVAIFQYLQQLSKMFFNIAASLQDVVQLKIDFKAIELIERDYSNFRKGKKQQNNNLKLWNKVTIKNLSFSYKNSYKANLIDVNMEFYSNSKIALVGESGSGKSTLLSIIRGLYKAQCTELIIDSQFYKDPSIFSSTATLILQEPEIFENTLGFNITFGMETTRKELDHVIRISYLEDVINALPRGLNTDIREKGVNLSGGEKQRLALARGLLAAKGSSLILLDEPTSSIDINNEIKIYDNILINFKDKCIISSIHRLHLLDRFDIVFVIAKGTVVQQGTFQALKQQKRLFAELWNKYIKEQDKNT